MLPCDRIIREDNGKFALIGVYSDGVILPSASTFPMQIGLWFWIRIQRQKCAATPIKLEVVNPEGSIVCTIDGEAVSSDLRPMALAVPCRVPTSLTGFGKYTVYLTVDQQRLSAGTFRVAPDAKTENSRTVTH